MYQAHKNLNDKTFYYKKTLVYFLFLFQKHRLVKLKIL